MSRNLAKMSKKVLAVITAGSEEMEFTITVDILRRAGVSTMQIFIYRLDLTVQFDYI